MKHLIYIYTLALENGFYYVGKTINPDRRFNEHFNDEGAVWTKLHRPISVIEKESFIVSSLEEEDRWENHQTIKMMRDKDWQMVRGGFWCNTDEILTIKNLQHHGYFLDVNIKEISFTKGKLLSYLPKLKNNEYYFGYSHPLKTGIKKHEKDITSNWKGINIHSKLIKEYEEKKSIIDYDLPLKDNERIMVIYVLLLENSFFHVSYSNDLSTLMQKYERGKCCEWCKLHKPVELLEIIPVICPKGYLDIINEVSPIVEKYFNEYGAEKVRGGRFPIVDEKLHLKKVMENYKIVDNRYIEYTKKEMNHLRYERKKQRKNKSYQ